MTAISRVVSSLMVLATTAACVDVESPGTDENEAEVITTVVLTFTPAGGGDAVIATHSDPENDGAPVIDAVVLADGTTYSLAVAFENRLEDPAEDLTEEVRAESDEHQVFIAGSGVQGPATGDNAAHVVTHAYVDTDDNGLPIGLDNTIVATATGSGELRVMLRHLPPENDAATKVAGLAEAFAAAAGAIAGDADADVVFPLTVE